MKEIWKDIKGYEGLYQISNEGRVKSLKRMNVTKERMMNVNIESSGYARTNLYINGNEYAKRIHRLVAEHFLDPVEGKDQVGHINGIKTDNRVENLIWSERGDNLRRILKLKK